MNDQNKDKNKPAKDRKEPDSKSGQPADLDENQIRDPVEETLAELENEYVTKPAKVTPPLPDKNPESITRSGVQKAYDPTDRNLFPEHSVYEMDAFVLDEVRLHIEAEHETKPWGDEVDSEASLSGQEKIESGSHALLSDDVAKELLEEPDPWAKEDEGKASEDPWAKIDADKPSDDPWAKDGAKKASEEDPWAKDVGETEVDDYNPWADDKSQDQDEDPWKKEEEDKGGKAPGVSAPDSDEWDKAKESFKGKDSWRDGEKAAPGDDKKEEAKLSESERVLFMDQDSSGNFDLLGEDSIYELEPIVIEQFNFGKLTEQTPEPDLNDDQTQDIVPQSLKVQAGVDSAENEAKDAEVPVERFPEHSNFEVEPIRLEKAIVEEAEKIDKQQEMAAKPDTPDSAFLPEPESVQSDQQVQANLNKASTGSSVDIDNVEVISAKPSSNLKDEEENDREVERTLLEGVPVITVDQNLTPGDSLTAPVEEAAPLDRNVEDTILEGQPFVLEDQMLNPNTSLSASTSQSTVNEVDSQPSKPDVNSSENTSDIPPVKTNIGAGGSIAHGSPSQKNDKPVELKEHPINKPKPQTKQKPLIELAQSTTPSIDTSVDEIAVLNETSAIKKEIDTSVSLSAVREGKIKQALKESGQMKTAGQTLENKYLIRGIIGQGGISVVYKAQDIATGQIVAIKALKKTDSSDQGRFDNEIETLGKLNHVNIVRAIESLTVGPNQQTFLVMENVKGISLQELIKQYGRAEHPEVIASILTQVCDGLAHAHEHRIIHRDLKGGNIVLTNVDEKILVKILDFGIAKIEDEDMQRVTVQGKAMGSPLYMSPEQCRGQSLTTRSDIYALGIVAYELITGELPVKGRSIVNVMAQHCDPDFKPVPLASYRPDLPGVHMLDQIISRALETDVVNRIQVAQQFKAGVEFWIESTRSKKLDRDVPESILFSQEFSEKDPVRIQKQSTAGVTVVKKEGEITSKQSDSLAEVLTTSKGIKNAVIVAAFMILVALVLCVVIMLIVRG